MLILPLQGVNLYGDFTQGVALCWDIKGFQPFFILKIKKTRFLCIFFCTFAVRKNLKICSEHILVANFAKLM
jgi:hypothetical protein